MEQISEHFRESALEALAESWHLSLRARNLSPQTQGTYTMSAAQLIKHLQAIGITEPEQITRAHLEAYIADLLATRSASTASVRFRSLQQWFAWMFDEGEIPSNPISRMRPPIVPEQPVPVLPLEEVRALIKACDGNDFVSRRDAALIAVFIDTGARLSEVAALRVDDVDLRRGEITVLGKGRSLRTLALGAASSRALDRYLRVRARHRLSTMDGLWLGERSGVMTSSGVAQALKRRAATAGIEGMHPHRLRHTAVHQWLSSGGNEGDAMETFGWRSRQMLARYGKSAAAERARSAHKRHGLMDRL